ncbi:hypothetical protein SY83_12525 [Paenibacillus swuensis]|uniref:RNA polymerase sigma factor n=1 Tax=Paenibacillus swuensis TaxID=1178515 RepID=A0A172TJJ5_9BACL|nr:sigma-70 family RNA polymerase sigma factor [Paenibacillus swuensis]ANE46963.1 hypothetical protein SY83_12525 [Paenibacillus swuensis]
MSFDYLQSITAGLDRNAALHDLMTEFGSDVWNYIYFLTRYKETADDLAQEVFIKVYEKMYTFRGHSSVKTWILSITRNTVHDYRRSAWFRRVMLSSGFMTAQQETAPSAEQDYMKHALREETWEVVLELPIKLREVLLLYAHHQLPMQQIGDLLGISQGTVKSRLSRARAKVNQHMRVHEGADERMAQHEET